MIMARLLGFVLLVLALAAGFAWLADRPGERHRQAGHDVEAGARDHVVVLAQTQRQDDEAQRLRAPRRQPPDDPDDDGQEDERADDPRHRPAATGWAGVAVMPP